MREGQGLPAGEAPSPSPLPLPSPLPSPSPSPSPSPLPCSLGGIVWCAPRVMSVHRVSYLARACVAAVGPRWRHRMSGWTRAWWPWTPRHRGTPHVRTLPTTAANHASCAHPPTRLLAAAAAAGGLLVLQDTARLRRAVRGGPRPWRPTSPSSTSTWRPATARWSRATLPAGRATPRIRTLVRWYTGSRSRQRCPYRRVSI